MANRVFSLLALTLFSFGLTGCHAASNAFWEKMGYEKRDLLVSDVKKARDEQDRAKVEIKTTMQRFKEVTGFQGGDLEAKYEQLKSSYDSAESRAAKVSTRIKNVESTADTLFSEWNDELNQYSDPKLKESSRQKLLETKSRYQQLIGYMHQAEGKMTPVLATFKDHVLSMKHQLNAAAISSLQGEATRIDGEVQQLIADMEKSIAEANSFINQMEKGG